MQANSSASKAKGALPGPFEPVGGPSGSNVSRVMVAVVALLLVAAAAPSALASQGETYGSVGGGYQLRNTADGLFHGVNLKGGVGWFPSDFTIGEVTGSYTLGYQGGLQHLLGVQGHFRILIDAFEWVPSIGPLVGVSGAYTADLGFEAFMDLGMEACLAWRGTRDHAWRACGQVSLVPAHTYFQSLFSVEFNYDWFLGL